MTTRRVLVVSEPMEYGVLAYLERLCDGLERSRWEPALAFSPRRMAPQAERLVGRLAARGRRVRRLPFHRGFGAGDLRAAAGLLGEIRAFRPDVLHLHSTKAGLIGRLAGALTGTPAVYTPHGTSWQYTGRTLGRVQLALERMLRRVTTTLLSVCPAEAATFVDAVGFDPARVRVVPAGVAIPSRAAVERARRDGRVALGAGPADVWLVVVARLTAEKGVDVLLRALAADVGVRGLLVVGDGPERGRLEALAARTRTAVRFCGYRADPWPFIAAADVLVQPSRSEGLPFALLDGMAHGLPVVATGVGGMPAAVDGCGLVVPPDDPAALGDALRRLVSDRLACRRLGDAGRARIAREFDTRAMIAALEDAYDAAAGMSVAVPARPAWRAEERAAH